MCQPYANLIVSGKKTIELRGWNTRHRGDLLIHAPSRIRTADCKRLGVNPECVTGAIVGIAELYGVKKYSTIAELSADSNMHHASTGRLIQYGFLLRHPRALRIPIPYSGRLGIFDAELPAERITQLRIRDEISDEEYRYRWVGHH